LNPTSEKKLRTPINIGFAVNSRIGVQQFSSIPRGIVVQTVSIPLVRIPKQLAVTEVSMRQQLRMAALAVSIVVALSTFTWAQDYDRDDYQRGGNVAQARQCGYQNGYRDGEKKGRHEGRENDPFDYRTPDWRQATHGYKSWMGPVNVFENGYQEGYRDGFRSGFASEQSSWRGNHRDGFYRGGSYYGSSNYGSNTRVAYDTGYQDGVTMAREDLYKNKPFNPTPRARFDDRDHGYRREYGDKNDYRAEYTDGYRAGYQATFDRRY